MQVKEYGPAANFKTRNEFIEDCKRKARKLPPLLRAVQSLQLAALESQKEAGNVDPETGKITRAEKPIVAKSNEKEEYEGRQFKLDNTGLSHHEIEKVEGLLKLGAEVTKQALLLHSQYKANAQITRKAEVAIIKARNELENPSNIKQHKNSYSKRFEPYKPNGKDNKNYSSWHQNTKEGWEGYSK